MVGYTSAVIINVSAFLTMLGVGMSVAQLPQKIIQLSGSMLDIGYLASAFALSFVSFQLPVGYLSDKFGIKPFLTAGYFICAVAGACYFFSTSPSMIFWGRLLQGIGEVPVWALAPAFLSLRFPAAKGKAVAVYNTAVHCGLTLGCLAGTLVEGNQPFLIFSCLSILAGGLVMFNVKNTKPKPAPWSGPGSYISLAGNLNTLAVFPGVILYGAGYGIFISVIPGFMIKEVYADAVGTLFILFYIAVSGAQVLAGPVSDRNGRKSVMVFGLLAAGTGMLVFSFLDLVWLLVLLFLSGAGLGAFCVAAMAYLNDTVPAGQKGCISGVFFFFWGAGYFSGPIILGRLTAAGLSHPGFAGFGGLLLLAGVACFTMVKEKRSTRAGSDAIQA